MISKKYSKMSKLWQISIIITIIYNKKDIVISAGITFDKTLFHQLIFLIKDGDIVFVIVPAIVFMTNLIYVLSFIKGFKCQLV